MAILKCKMCGGDMDLSPDKSFGTCEYCGSTMTLPKIDDEQRAAAFNRGNHFRRQGEFDKALAVYERIVAEDDTDAEAHWCCALCRFGIEYVEDPTTYEYLPTCHRASFDSILEDVDYLAAVEHSDGITRRQYQKDAAKIAEVQRGILTTVNQEEPFDVFLCYKETDTDTGERSRDSMDAQEVYYQLTEKGYRVFFSRITLEDKVGTEYEPYIFAALNSAKVMIVLGEKPEHFSAVWVKNEWSRFLALMKKDRSKLLLPCYKNMDPYDLPEQLAVLQSYDMGKIGFMQDLIRGVEKVLHKEKPKETAPASQVVQQVVQGGGPNIAAQIKRGQQALEDRDWQAADTFFDKALDMDAECAEAFWGKALAAAQCRDEAELIQKRMADVPTTGEELTACPKDTARIEAAGEYYVPGYLPGGEITSWFSYDKREYNSMTRAWKDRIEKEKDYWDGNRFVSRALRYAKGDYAEKLKSLRAKVEQSLQERLSESEAADVKAKAETAKRYAEEMEKASQQAKAVYDAAVQKREADYRSYCDAQAQAKTEQEYVAAEGNFKQHKMQGYADCYERAKQCREAAAHLRAEAEAEQKRVAERKRKTAGITIAAVAVVAAVVVAATLIVTKVVIPGNQYRTAETLFASGDYDSAVTAFEALGDYKDSVSKVLEVKYAAAEAMLASGDYAQAITAFEALGNYKDSSSRVKYIAAEAMLASGDNAQAAIAFAALGDYKDAKVRMVALWDEIAVRDTVAAGQYHTVGLKSDRSVVAVGYNDYGRCDVGDWTDIVSIVAGLYHTVGLKSDGTVVAIGNNKYGQSDVGGWTDIVAISAGVDYTVGLKSDGTAVAVGYNYDGQSDVGDWMDIVAISAGSSHTVGLKSDGTVVAVGNNYCGQCEVGGWADIVAISAGSSHTVGLKSDGTVVAVGFNYYTGKCNVGDWTDIVAISAGDSHTVGLKSDGTVVSVGNNDGGQCNVGGWTNIVAISAGGYYTVGLKSDGTVVAVGNNKYGQCDVGGWTGIKVPNK